MSDPQRLEYLFKGYCLNQITEAERLELSVMVRDSSDQEISNLMKKAWDEIGDEAIIFNVETSSRMLAEILHRKEVPVRKMIWTKLAVAAVILFIAVGVYLLLNRHQNTKQVAEKEMPADILPGHDGAILTLGNGRTIVLDSAENGKITDAAIKSGNILKYQNSDETKVEYNTMTTPKGRQYSLILPDGTQVWLNAASSIRYPTAFVGKERKVSITGEAYFEVFHDASKPFHVNVKGMDVQVLGTHFNINSYTDEQSVKTTLLQGSIKITVAGKTQMVKPREQTQVTSDNEIRLIRNADVNAAVAWKNGFFQFNGMGIESVMRQLERWYDIEVRYEGNIPARQFAGQIDRSATLSQVLKILKESNVHFHLDNRTLVVTP